ncbi:uncharacterized protein LOC133899721 [Phragmites australis]|uniref:uncharacterized protein LOC133899721 n=1 Tax=Phragmites australis TaxID=29695 RepID=UPI002D789F42|nr:uncharacterized protein LOC133899721 [Phragmites australis]
MAPLSRRPVLVLFLLLALFCSHIALCSSAESGKAKPKASGGRKALLASSAGDDGEEVAAAKPAATGRIKKKLLSDAKNQTKVAKAKKPESTTTAKATKKTTVKAAVAGAAAIAKAKVPKVDKAAAAKAKGADSANPAKVSKTSAAKPTKTAKSEAAASASAKAKKPINSTADAGAKTAKSGKKAQVVAEGKASKKVNATVSKKAASEVEEDAEEAEGTEDLISEFQGLPARLQETFMPDLARLSHRSKAYLSAANAGIAAAAATAASVALLLLPLCILTALVQRMGPYLPLLHRALLLAQAYLAIYFATLALAAAATGLEPLRFFHATSPAAYAWTQAAQSLGFMVYLVLQMVDLVAVFSGAASPEEDGNGDATKSLGLAQMVVGLAVGLHYYAAVFHRAAAGEAPRANWRVYTVYAACFVIICACARAERRKKAYLAGSGGGAAEDWKKS